jgi:hypothetical protein
MLELLNISMESQMCPFTKAQICTNFAKLMLPHKVCVRLTDHNHNLHFELQVRRTTYWGELPISKLDAEEKIKLHVQCFKGALPYIAEEDQFSV